MGNSEVVIQAKHGSSKFDVKLPWQASVSHLLQEIERRTGVPPHCQRVIYDGRALNGSPNDADTELGALGLRNPAKVMILGKKPDEEDANYKKMKEWEGQCDKAAAKLQAIGDDISELEKGFAPDQLLRDSLPKTTKQINVISEELMKVLLSLDGLSFSDAQKESRAKRKVLIDRINRMHDQCDRMTSQIQQLRAKV